MNIENHVMIFYVSEIRYEFVVEQLIDCRNPNSFVEREALDLEDDHEVIQKMQYWPAFNKEFQSYTALGELVQIFLNWFWFM